MPSVKGEIRDIMILIMRLEPTVQPGKKQGVSNPPASYIKATTHTASCYSPTQRPTHPSGRIIFTYKGPGTGGATLAWSPNGKRIASGSTDKTVQVWVAL